MIIPKHLNSDSEELADGWHALPPEQFEPETPLISLGSRLLFQPLQKNNSTPVPLVFLYGAPRPESGWANDVKTRRSRPSGFLRRENP
ncbi:MAG TPA: hypothetical protein VIU93_15495 [Gallionellaceae bacterium]